MQTSKARKKSGWIYPDCVVKAKKIDIINECLEPQPCWDDWNDYRDGQRDWYSDGKKIKNVNINEKEIEFDSYEDSYEYRRIIWNNKNKRLLRIRKAKKAKQDGNV